MNISIRDIKDLVAKKKFITMKGLVYKTEELDYLTNILEEGTITESDMEDFIYGYKVEFLRKMIEGSKSHNLISLPGLVGRVRVSKVLSLLECNEHFVCKVDLRDTVSNLVAVEF